MIVTMYIRPDQLKELQEKGKGYASTYRTHEECFEIQIDIGKIDLETHEKGMPWHHYFIKTKGEVPCMNTKSP